MLSRKVMIIRLISGQIKKIHSIRMSLYFPKSYEHSGENVIVELDLLE